MKNPWAIKNFLPERYQMEDDHSIKSHMAVMNRITRLPIAIQDYELVRISMDKIFPERRDYIVNNIRRVNDIDKTYP